MNQGKLEVVKQEMAFFTVQLSHPYMTNGKTIALTRRTLTRRTLVSKIMSLLLNMLSRLVIAFLPIPECKLLFPESWPQKNERIWEVVKRRN